MNIFAISLTLFLALHREANSQCCIFSTTGSGNPLTSNVDSLTAGRNGPVLLEDIELIDELTHANREKIPERVAHAKGVGAKGYFVVTNDITRYSAAGLFSEVGKVTRVAARLSAATNPKGHPDTDRGTRGLAFKFYTEDGIWDLLQLNIPAFLVNDGRMFTQFGHASGRDPATNLPNPNALWDIITLRPETIHGILWLFSDYGFPFSLRHINGYSINTFRLVDSNGNFVYVRFNTYTNQGVRLLTSAEAAQFRAADPDHYARDLLTAINSGNYPSWNLTVQIMAQEQVNNALFNPLDATKLWPETLYPPVEIGQIVLNETVQNYFEEVEQIAFSPANLVPGIRPSADKLLQARLFSYGDAQRYRLGVNFPQLPVNRPNVVRNIQRDGFMNSNNQVGVLSYYPNSFGGPEPSARASNLSAPFEVSGTATRYSYTDDPYSQARDFYLNTLNDTSRQNLINTIAAVLSIVQQPIRTRAVNLLANVDQSLSESISDIVSSN